MARLKRRGGVGKKGWKHRVLFSLPLLHFFALVPFFARPKPKIPFLGLSLLRNQETLAAQADAGYIVSCCHRLLRAKIKGEGGGKAKGKTKGEGENKGQRKRKS